MALSHEPRPALWTIVQGGLAGSRADTRGMASAFDRLDARLRRLPDWAIFAAGMAIVAIIAGFKVSAGKDVPVADFFLIPVAAIGWLTRGRSYAYIAAASTAVVTVIIAEVGQARDLFSA